jgi:hypothetical protein
MGRKTTAPGKGRPMPPTGLGNVETDDWISFAPAPEVEEWIRTEILAEGGRLYNPDHQHLIDCSLRFLWAAGGFQRQGKNVVGTAEEVAFRCNAWQKGRQEQQMRQWFGHVPDYLITVDASYCLQCSDVDFCALVEHEMYHVAHKRDMFGAPAFTQDGLPKIGIQGHDVEEFVGVVRRYGVGDPNGAIAKLARAANSQPEVSRLSVAGACGTCLQRVA